MGSKSVMENFQVITALIEAIIAVIITICYSYSAKRELVKNWKITSLNRLKIFCSSIEAIKKDAPEAAIEGS